MNIEASAMTGVARVLYKEDEVSGEQIVDHIRMLGHTVKILLDSVTIVFQVLLLNESSYLDFQIPGPVDVSEICDKLSLEPGVLRTEVDVVLHDHPNYPVTIFVDFFPEQTGTRTLYEFLQAAYPYAVIAVKSITEFEKKNVETDPLEILRARFYTSLIFFFPMVLSVYVFPYVSYFHEWTSWILFRGLPVKFFVEWLLATPVQLWLAKPIYKSAWEVRCFLLLSFVLYSSYAISQRNTRENQTWIRLYL